MSLAKRLPILNDTWANNRRYGIIIDAGSSGSRIYVYSWKDHEHVKSIYSPEELKGKIPVVERGDKEGFKWTLREEPGKKKKERMPRFVLEMIKLLFVLYVYLKQKILGISTYGSKPAEVGEHLRGLLDFASEVVPEESHRKTPIYLMATAGMRLLPVQESKAVLNATCSFIQDNYSFFMSNCESHIQIITGQREGVYGWVAINYLMGGFDTSIQASLQSPTGQREQHHTFGFLDMGGASTQIAFEPEHHQKEEHMDDLTQIYLRTLDGHQVEYDVFVTTFLGYGSNEARRRYLEQRLKDAHDDPDRKVTLNEDHTLHLDDPCLPLNLTMADSFSTSIPLTLHGIGSFDECLEKTLPLLNKSVKCTKEPCLFNGVHTPHIDWSVNKFVGISEYWYSSHDILGLGGVYDFHEYEQKATDYCGRDWSKTMEAHKDLDPVEVSRYQLQCFKSAWIVNMLHDGISVPRTVDPSGHNGPSNDKELLEQSIESIESKNWNPPFQSINTINDIQVSWTLGAMVLIVSNQIPLLDYNDHYQGHNTDDEGPHQLPDGISPPAKGTLHTIGSGNLMQSIWEGSSLASFAILTFVVLCFMFLWCLFKRVRKKDRSDEYRRVDQGANGGILGIGSMTNTSRQSVLYTLTNGLASAFSRSTLSLRYWASRLLRSRSTAMPPVSVEIDALSEQTVAANDNIAISMSPSLTPRATLPPSTKSFSAVSTKYWSKKRYSGDSHGGGFPMGNVFGDAAEGSSVLPFRTSSVVNLANRNGSSSNLTARIGSSNNLNGLAPEVRALSPLAGASAERPISMRRSRSRNGFVIHELSDEDDYAASDSAETMNSAPQPPMSGHVWLPGGNASPRGSPRTSLDERRSRTPKREP
ncbi:Golgi apyrase [Apophysomyces ossiformis]|uniref:Golgi apyrase n=1 Tax=Apophysomyces ossiformis TaxID=679940 RepID=A0A8H7BKV8_9FUNG|nr:Golgi apyrase [Apophysomyces ossiformis]